MRLALVVAGLCVSIFGAVHLLMGRTPRDDAALLTQAPASVFAQHATLFERLRASLLPSARR
jgi:hypothetical protein